MVAIGHRLPVGIFGIQRRVQRLRRPARLEAQYVERPVGGDTQQPGFEAAPFVVAKRIQGVVGAQECVLGHVVGEVGAPHIADGDAVDGIAVAVDQNVVGIEITAAGALECIDSRQATGKVVPAEVSQRVLGRYWKERTPEEQKAFIDLLTELFINVAYPRSAEFFADLQIDVTDERIKGDEAEVKTTVSDPKEGLISVDYRLQQHNGAWHVRDIILDDVSLVRNLRSQIQQVIAEHSYDELLRRMRDKLNENL